jgi:hypothetical protein
MIKGQPIDPAATYSILACEREGDPEDMLCRMKKVKEGKNTNFTLHQVMSTFLKTNSPVTPNPEGNAVILDASQLLLTQVYGVDYQFH